MAYYEAYQQEKDGKTSVWYYRGKTLGFRIIQYDNGYFHALTDLKNMAGNYVPTLEIAKQRIEEFINTIDRMTGKKSRITWKYL